jgi:preprotein translocase subunit SecF
MLTLTNVVIILVIGIILFFLLREVNCWYWKINRHIELQEETNILLKKIVEQTVDKNKVKEKELHSISVEQTSVNDPTEFDKLIESIGRKK